MKATSIYIGDITFDAQDPSSLACFWAEALHYEIQFSSEEFAAIVDPSGQRSRCCFQKNTHPKTSKNRIHLDLFASDMEAEVQRLILLGAQKVRVGEDGDIIWTVMNDPEGNEFCVQPPQNHLSPSVIVPDETFNELAVISDITLPIRQAWQRHQTWSREQFYHTCIDLLARIEFATFDWEEGDEEWAMVALEGVAALVRVDMPLVVLNERLANYEALCSQLHSEGIVVISAADFEEPLYSVDSEVVDSLFFPRIWSDVVDVNQLSIRDMWYVTINFGINKSKGLGTLNPPE